MERLNQTLAALFGSLLFACGIAVGLGALFAAGPYSLTLSTGEQWTVYRLSPTDQMLGVVLGLLVAVLGLALGAVVVLGSPRSTRLVIRSNGPNRTTIETEVATGRVQAAVEQVQGVVRADVRLLAGRRSVLLLLDLRLDSVAPVASVTEVAEQRARVVVEKDLGLTIQAVKTTVRRPSGPKQADREVTQPTG